MLKNTTFVLNYKRIYKAKIVIELHFLMIRRDIKITPKDKR